MGNQDDQKPVMIRTLSNGYEIHWKFNQLLNQHGITYYRLHQSNPTKFTLGTMSRWHTSAPRRPELDIIAELLSYLSNLSGRTIPIDELMELIPPPDETVI